MKLSEAIKNFEAFKKFASKQATVKGYGLTLRQFALFMRDCEVENVRPQDVAEWFNGMQNLDWDRNSFVGKAVALRKLFEWATHSGFMVFDPWLIPIPQKEHKLPRVATDECYYKLLNVIPDNNDPRHIRNKAIITMLWDTGARNGEILALDVNDVDLNNKRALIRTEKNKGSRPFRELFWTDQTNDNLGMWIEKREYLKNRMTFFDADALFISICASGLGNRSGQRFNIKGTGEMLRRYSNRAGIESLNAHSFRHRKGHTIIEQGGSSSDVMNVLGHASLQSSSIYTMMRGKELEARARKFM